MQTASLYLLGSVLAATLLVPLAIFYVRNASALTAWIDMHDPDLWESVWRDSFSAAVRPNLPPYFRSKGRRLDGILFFNRAADQYPDNPEFRVMLGRCRWLAFFCAFAFLDAILLLGRATALS